MFKNKMIKLYKIVKIKISGYLLMVKHAIFQIVNIGSSPINRNVIKYIKIYKNILKYIN